MRVAYSEKNGEVIKRVVGETRQPSHDSTIDKPFHQRMREAYYALECQHKLSDRDFKEFGGARKVSDLWRDR